MSTKQDITEIKQYAESIMMTCESQQYLGTVYDNARKIIFAINKIEYNIEISKGNYVSDTESKLNKTLAELQEMADFKDFSKEKAKDTKALHIGSVRLSLPTTKELREARELYELQVKSNSMIDKPISGHWQEGVEWILSRIIEGNEV